MMKSPKASVLFFSIMLFLVFLGSVPQGIAVENISSSTATQPKISFQFLITNVDPSTKTVDVEGTCFIQNISSDPVLHCTISGGDEPAIQPISFECSANSEGVYLGAFNGTFILAGRGDLFPFDSYILTLRFDIIENVNLSVVHVQDNQFLSYSARFSGIQKYALQNAWNSDINGFLPISPSSISNEIYVDFERTDSAFNLNFMVFLLPIIAIYYFLGSTLIIDSKNHLNERLTMYVALLFFVPLYLLSFQTLMPYRPSISFPEILLINLLISTTILTICSLIGKYKSNTGYSWQKPAFTWDSIAVSLSLIVLFALYVFAMPSLTNQASFLFLYGIIPAYCFWMIFKIRLTRDMGKQFILGFLAGLVILISFCLVSLFVNFIVFQFLILIIGSFIAGLSFSAFMPNRRICIPLAFVSAILWTIISGAYMGGFIGGLPGATSTVLSFGILGGVFAVFTTGGSVTGLFISQSRFKKRILKDQKLE